MAEIGADCFPEPVPLNMRIHWRRQFARHEEWKIEYDVETAETMPAERGRSVPAYLLVPRGDQKAPMPAMICFHQCALNCAIGKEAVVGKAPWSHEASDWESELPQAWIAASRLDQAYGLDLVQQGFVVLAPDSICCGERHVEAIRQPGDNADSCWKYHDEQLGRDGTAKHTLDGVRAVDLLESLDFVDTDRVGAIGHSMGASDVENLMLADERVRAGIISGGSVDFPKFLPLLSPRLYIVVAGEYDGPADRLDKARTIHKDAQSVYGRDGSPENFVLLTGRMGHTFADRLKWQAFKRLQEYFGVLQPRTEVDLGEILTDAWEASRWMAEEEQGGTFSRPPAREGCVVLGNRGELVSALAGLFLHASDQVPQADLRVSVEESLEAFVVDCLAIPGRSVDGDAEGACYQTLREVERVLSEHDAVLQRDASDCGPRYRISFRKAAAPQRASGRRTR